MDSTNNIQSSSSNLNTQPVDHCCNNEKEEPLTMIMNFESELLTETVSLDWKARLARDLAANSGDSEDLIRYSRLTFESGETVSRQPLYYLVYKCLSDMAVC
jgi:hypothetical protein